MFRRILCALVLGAILGGSAAADDFYARITKVQDGKITFLRREKPREGKRRPPFHFSQIEETFPAAGDVKVVEGKWNRKAQTYEAGENLPDGLTNEWLKDIQEPGLFAQIRADDSKKTIKEIRILLRKPRPDPYRPRGHHQPAENTTVTQIIEGRERKFVGRGKTMFEGLAVALLGSCAAETTLHFGKKEHWDEALKGDHILVTFAKPREIAVNDQQDSAKESELHASQILIPIGPYRSPKQIYVRSGDRYRTFSKYEVEVCDAFQKRLQRMLPLPRLKPLAPK